MIHTRITPARFLVGTLVLAAFIAGRYSVNQSSTVSATESQLSTLPEATPSISESEEATPVEVVTQAEEEAEAFISLEALMASTELFELRNNADAQSLREMLVEWAKTDPLAALAFAQSQIDPPSESSLAVTAILAQWASQQPTEAWDWTEQNSVGNTARLLTAIAKVDPELAWEKSASFAMLYPELPLLGYVNSLEGMLKSGEHQQLLEFVDTLELDWEQDGNVDNYPFVEQIISDWVLHSPENAAAWFASLPEDTESSNRKANVGNALLVTWATTDPIQAMGNAEHLFTDPAQYKDALEIGIDTLTRKDLASTEQWLENYGPGPEIDWPLVDFVSRPRLLNQDIDKAIYWAGKITHPGYRDEAYTNIASHWLISEPEVAARFFEENNVLSERGMSRAQSNAYRETERRNTVPTYNGLN